MQTASTRSVQAATGGTLTRSQAEAAVAQRLQVLGHPPDLLDRPATACLVGYASGSERQLRAGLAAVLFVASTEDAPKVDAALVRRALQTGRDADQAPSRPGWRSVGRNVWARAATSRGPAGRSGIWRDNFRISLAAACIAALASVAFVIYARGYGGFTARPVWAERFTAQAPHAGPAAALRAPVPPAAVPDAAPGGQVQRLASAAPRQDQPQPAEPPGSPVAGQAPDHAGPREASGTPNRVPSTVSGPAQQQAAGRAGVPPIPGGRTATPTDGPDAVPPTQAEIAGLRQLQASAGDGLPAAASPRPGAPAASIGSAPGSAPSGPTSQAPTSPGPTSQAPASLTPATSVPSSLVLAPPAPAAPVPAAPRSGAPVPDVSAPAAPVSGAPVPAAPLAASPAPAPAHAGDTQTAALQAFAPPESVRSLPVPPSAGDVRAQLALPGKLKTAAQAAVLLLYPERDAEALRRLRPLAMMLQHEGIANIRARPTRALPARRAISYFYSDDEPLAHVIAQTLSQADWPQLKGNSLQPSLVLLPPGLHPRRPGTIEIQLP